MHNDQRENTIELYLCKALLLVANTMVFTCIWYFFYDSELYTPFYAKGNYVVITLFLVTYMAFARLYQGFSLTTSRIQELVYSQFVALAMTHLILYFVVWLLERKLPNVLPLLLCLALCGAVSTIWAKQAHLFVQNLYQPRRTLLVFGEARALKSGKKITSHLAWRFDVVDMVDAHIGLKRIQKIIKERDAECLFLCGVPSEERNDILKYSIQTGLSVYIRPKIGDLIISGASQLQAVNLPILLCQRLEPSLFYLAGKRFFDIALSLIGLILASPIMLITAIAIKVYDGGPVLYKQRRLTKDGKEFNILKLRSMKIDAEKDGVAQLSTGDKDDRVTPVGKLIRKCRADELPQLLNILFSDMTIVGPRPERPEIAHEYEKELPEFALRLQAKAGLTGYAQVYGKYNSSPYDKLQMDLMYISRQGFATDIKIILATIKVLFIPESTEGVAPEDAIKKQEIFDNEE